METLVSGYVAGAAERGVAEIGIVDAGEGEVRLGIAHNQQMEAVLKGLLNLYKENIKKLRII